MRRGWEDAPTSQPRKHLGTECSVYSGCPLRSVKLRNRRHDPLRKLPILRPKSSCFVHFPSFRSFLATLTAVGAGVGKPPVTGCFSA